MQFSLPLFLLLRCAPSPPCARSPERRAAVKLIARASAPFVAISDRSVEERAFARPFTEFSECLCCWVLLHAEEPLTPRAMSSLERSSSLVTLNEPIQVAHIQKEWRALCVLHNGQPAALNELDGFQGLRPDTPKHHVCASDGVLDLPRR